MFSYFDDPGFSAEEGGVCHEREPRVTHILSGRVPEVVHGPIEWPTPPHSQVGFVLEASAKALQTVFGEDQ